MAAIRDRPSPGLGKRQRARPECAAYDVCGDDRTCVTCVDHALGSIAPDPA